MLSGKIKNVFIIIVPLTILSCSNQSIYHKIVSANKNNIQNTANQEKLTSKISQDVIKSHRIKEIILARGIQVLKVITENNMIILSSFIHPNKGVRLSPYSYIDIERDLVFKAPEFKNIINEEKKYLWGYYDGSGEPITLNFGKYLEKFVYCADFINAEQISYNKVLGRGNTINNLTEVYPNAKFVEYYFSGFDPKYEGMDWKSLRLVFEEQNDMWFLIAIIHDQWTI